MKQYKKEIFNVILIVLFQTFMYFIVKFTPIKINVIGSSIDNKIPFISYFIYPYISWYIMLFIIPFIISIKDKKMFKILLKTSFYSICCASIIYFLYPTTIIRNVVTTSSFTDKIVNLIYFLDTPNVNCFPSMHCIMSFIFIYVTINNKNLSKIFRITTSIWAVLIILSTLFVKQHIVLDIISAFILSIILFVFSKCDCKMCVK